MRRRWIVAALITVLVTGACGGGGGGDDEGAGFDPVDGGAARTVLVDYRHDEFASAFLRYYPETVKIHPGDVINFRQTWTGEPHSVTMGKVVDAIFEGEELFKKYESPEEALAAGVPQAEIDALLANFAKVPGMTTYEGYELYQPGAQPCYVADIDRLPAFSDPETEDLFPDAKCPDGGQEQMPFDGRQALYNSGFIPAEGEKANLFSVPIGEDAEPGTYRYYCNYHWTSMSGTIEIVAEDVDIPTQQDLNREARKEIEEDAEFARERVDEAKAAKGGKVGDLALPLAGREADEEFAVIINEFLPRKVKTEVGETVTWTIDGIDHTVSFNVPKYFPVFNVKDDRVVEWNPNAWKPIKWDVPPPPDLPRDGPDDNPAPRNVDVGEWDGKGGFHSSGALSPGDTFTVTFTKAGTYPFACVLHPQMVGSVTVKA